MTRTKFYRNCLKRAWNSGYWWASLAALLALFVGGALAYEHPEWGNTVTALMWAVPLAVFIATAIVAWTLAPYAMYRELEQSSDDVIKELRESAADLQSKLDKKPTPEPPWHYADFAEIKGFLHALYRESCGLNITCWSGFMDWYLTVQSRLHALLQEWTYVNFDKRAAQYIEGPHANLERRGQAAYADCLTWLERICGEVRPDQINTRLKILDSD
jgi:hypothetical protein